MNLAPLINTVAPTTLSGVKCLKSRRSWRGNHRLRAQTTVEFALICLPFFAILFAIVDYAQIYFYENALQNSMREAARFGTAGRIIQLTVAGVPVFETNSGGVAVPEAIPSAYVAGEASRNECIRYWFLSNCIIRVLPLSNIAITSAPTLPGVPPVTSTNNYGQLILESGYTVTTNAMTSVVSTNAVPAVKGPGNANDYMQITATYSITTITPLFGYLGGYSRNGFDSYPVYVSAIVKNEPALLNFEHTNMYPGEP